MHYFVASTSTSTTHDCTFFNFNSDLSGEVVIKRGDAEMRVPAEHLLQFMAELVRGERISALQTMSDKEVLGISP